MLHKNNSLNVLPRGMTQLHTLAGHTNGVSSVAWSPDGQWLASGCHDGAVRIWNLAKGKLVYTLEGHTDRTHSVTWSPNGKFLASGSADDTVRIWNLATGKILHILEGHRGTILSVAWSPDGKLLASGSVDRTVRLSDPITGKTLHTLRGHIDWVSLVTWSPDGKLLASGSADDTIHVWQPETGEELYALAGHAGTILSLDWSPDGKWLASGSVDRTIRIWQPGTGKLIYKLHGHAATVASVAWSPDGKLLASGSHDKTVRIWNPATGKLLHTLEGHISMFRSTVWSSDGRLLLIASDKGDSSSSTTVSLWRTGTWERLAILSGLHGIFPTTWHPTRPLIALAGSNAGEIAIWKLDMELLLQTTPSPEIVQYANAKVVLIGDTGVGKTALGLVLLGENYRAVDSTHARRIWSFDEQVVVLDGQRSEKRETLLWDLAGQPGYRLTHQLSFHHVTVALVVFDARSDTEPFVGVMHWNKALSQAQRVQGNAALPLKKLLVAARIDRGRVGLDSEQMQAQLKEWKFDAYFETSAKEGINIPALRTAINQAIDWKALPKVSSTVLFQQIKSFLVEEKKQPGGLLSSISSLYKRFLETHQSLIEGRELLEEFQTCIELVEDTGLIRQLSFGKLVLLQPELLDAYASALVNAVKDGSDWIGSITEEQASRGDFHVPIDVRLKDTTQEILLLRAMIEDLLRYELVLREGEMLIFPTQSGTKAPDPSGKAVIIQFEGAILSIYTTLIVRLAHSGIFKKQKLWGDAIQYTTSSGGIYGLHLLERGEGNGELTLFFDDLADKGTKQNFQAFVLEYVQQRALPDGFSMRLVRVCVNDCGETFNDKTIQQRLARGLDWLRCPRCDTRNSLVEQEPPQTTTSSQAITNAMDQAADTQRDLEVSRSILIGKIATNDFDVFLCYNKKDREFVQKIGQQLKKWGILPWLDEWELRPGLPWQRIEQAQIARIKTAAVFFGKGGVDSWQRQQLDAFLNESAQRDCPVIPVFLPDAPQRLKLPLFLQGRGLVDFRQQEPDPLQQLRWGITGEKQ